MKKKYGLIISIIGIIFIIIALCLYFFVDKKSDTNKESNTEKQEKREEVSLDGLAEFLMFNVPTINSLRLDDSKYVYQDKKVTIDDFNSSEIYAIAISLIDYDNVEICGVDEDCDYKVKLNIVQDKIKELFGDIKIEVPNETKENLQKKCTLNDDIYVCEIIGEKQHHYNSYTLYFQAYKDYLDIKTLLKAEKDSKYLYVYEQYANVRLDSSSSFDKDNLDTYNYYIYNSSNSDTKITEDRIIGKDYYEDPLEKVFETKITEKYGDLFGLYMHKFKIEKDNTYKWVSTEPVQSIN